MDCVNHTGTSATAFCQSCGKALCQGCARNAAGGQVLCEPCHTAWQTYQQPFVPINTGAPNPAAAAVLGLIPGVGAMYNGQFFKGLIHVVIFAVLVSITSTVHGIFGIFIGAWILYQSFEAFHTAKALRDGQPVPDPLGLNEVGNWLNLGKHPQYPGQPLGQPGAGPSQPPPTSGAWQPPSAGAPYQAPYQGQWQTPPATAPADPNAPPPPIPPDPSAYWGPVFARRGAPIGAVVLIALGMLFLIGQLDIFNGRLIEFSWPIFLIGLGVWLIVRRLGESQGGPK
ncbi:MAG: B-box zinc finger protein [Terracidiphilus sp.]|nr:B-box zinc finger protein [Terracidiphilus sp.]